MTPKDKISTTTIDEWTRALKWHPDLARDLRACRAMIANERRYKNLWQRVRLNWIPQQWMFYPGKPVMDMPNSHALPVFIAGAWIHLRYQRLWEEAPALPARAIHDALHTAVEAGAWTPAAEEIRRAVAGEVSIHERAGFVRADVFNDVEQVHTPEWVAAIRNSPRTQALLRAGAWEEDIPRYPAILLTITPDGTLSQAMKVLEAAWDDIKSTLNPQIGTRQGKGSQGRIPDFAQYVTLYRLYRTWEAHRIARGEKPSQMAFAKAISTRQLPVQRRASTLYTNKRGQQWDRLGWLINATPDSAEYIAKRLRTVVLPLLEPSRSAPSLRDLLMFE